MTGLDLAIPSLPALAGLPLSAQWIARDAAANAAGAVMSTAVAMKLGM